jgi:hypothetical protein
MLAICAGHGESATGALERKKVKSFPELLNSASFHY